MGFLDSFKKKGQGANTGQADGEQATRPRTTDFRARENQPAATLDENAGLPSVNRRKGGNKLVTVLGFGFVLVMAAIMLFVVNGKKPPTKKRSAGGDEQVTSTLPPIALPAPSAPAPVAEPIALVGGSATPANTGKPTAMATASSGSYGGQASAPMGPNGKPPMEWTDRKMSGGLLVGAQLNGGGGPTPVRASASQADTAQATSSGSFGGNPNSDLGAKLEPTVTKGVSASVLADRNFLITKGTTLDCALETALDSSVPGITTCRLTRDVYSDNGQVLLLDRGSQLVGEYQSGLKQGQVRLFVLWTRAKTPNGVIVNLNSPGTDALGRSGLEGWVDNHFMERFGAAILMSFVKDSVTAMANRSNSGTTNYYGSAASGGEKIIEKMLDSTVNIPPTIVKNQGDHIQVMVARDLDFSTVYSLRPVK